MNDLNHPQGWLIIFTRNKTDTYLASETEWLIDFITQLLCSVLGISCLEILRGNSLLSSSTYTHSLGRRQAQEPTQRGEEIVMFFRGRFPIISTFPWGCVPAVVSSVRLDAAALGTLVNHLSWFELQTLDEFFCSISFGHGSLSKWWGGGNEKEFSFLFCSVSLQLLKPTFKWKLVSFMLLMLH